MSPEQTVTPYTVEGTVEYDRLLERFGADPVTDAQRAKFPEPVHPLVRREVFYAQRDLDRFLSAATGGRAHAIVTGRGPSGPMHVGHVVPFYLAKHLQNQTGATVYVPFSDDETAYLTDQSPAEIDGHLRANLRDVLAVGFDPARTRIVIDTADADIVYPIAAALAEELTPATVEATYGEPPNVGLSMYPAVQAAHLLLPQFVAGAQPTLVPIAIDQDPHIRVARDIAGKERHPAAKPAALLSKFLPGLSGPGKMSSSDDAPSLRLTDDRETIATKIRKHAYSGGQSSVAAHRERGGDPEVDVAYQLLHAFFEPDDERIAELADAYRSGELLSGELKQIAAEQIGEFVAAHRERRAAVGPLETALEPYRLTAAERAGALERAGYPDGTALGRPG